MIAIKIKQQKDFMSKLLITTIFDDFLLEEATIDTYNTFTINGKINKDFYKYATYDDTVMPRYSHSEWKAVRHICLNLIKGKQTPLGFKIVLLLNNDKKSEVFKKNTIDISMDQFTPCINIKYFEGNVMITTGVSYGFFTLDKEIEKAWDCYIPRFLDLNNIDYEIF